MYNTRKLTGSFKGYIGECMFKCTDKHIILTRFISKSIILTKFSGILKKDQIKFLKENWYSIDALKIEPQTKIILYEIKTKNEYRKKLYYKPKMTLSTHNTYNRAKELGLKLS